MLNELIHKSRDMLVNLYIFTEDMRAKFAPQKSPRIYSSPESASLLMDINTLRFRVL
jgi:hypothetical protein